MIKRGKQVGVLLDEKLIEIINRLKKAKNNNNMSQIIREAIIAHAKSFFCQNGTYNNQ